MQISEAFEVAEVRSPADANTLMRDGWKLLAVAPGSTGGNGSTYVIYVLGKPKPVSAGVLNPRTDPQRR